MKRVLIIGANSAIAEAVARQYAQQGAALYLIARDKARLAVLLDDLKVRGAAELDGALLDMRDLGSFDALVRAAFQRWSGLDVVLIAHGTLSSQPACEQDPTLLPEQMTINAVSVMQLCLQLAALFEAQHAGVLAVISSVAGDRGRKSNFVYGAAKAAVSTFLSGLRQRLYRSGVAVVTIKPGFVDTPMTSSFPKGLLWAKPDKVARDIVRAIERRTPVVYTPWFWRLILLIVRSVPERVFIRL